MKAKLLKVRQDQEPDIIIEEYSPYHEWGDNWPYWSKLYEAEHFIWVYTYRYSRCNLISKEKYGTLRYEYLFPPGGSVRFGPHLYVPFLRRTVKIANKKFPNQKIYIWMWSQSWLYRLWAKYGRWVLRKAIKKACEKYPEVKAEILEDYHEEFL